LTASKPASALTAGALTVTDSVHGERRLAWAQQPGREPGLFWLSGLLSDMGSTKASALAAWAAGAGHGMTRFDYSGHGASSGRFVDGTIGLWLADASAVFAQTRGPQVIIGSSMGGWVALRLVKVLRETDPAAAARIAGLLLIAPAWDMTEALMWAEMAPAARETLTRDGQWMRPSEYADDGYPITRALIEEGRNHLLPPGPLSLGCPVHILHGEQDADVPFSHSLTLMERLSGSGAQLHRVPDGDHRLSRPQDLAELTAIVADIIAAGA
jgi:pimeloyl-ACP methyl ester carboxylesterase